MRDLARFADRHDAGRQLALALGDYRASRPVVLGLPRGGIPVASEVAVALNAPLDVLVVRKIGVPFHRELAMGAIGEEDVLVVDSATVTSLHISDDDVARIATEERAELDRRVRLYRHLRPMCELTGRVVIVVDDGIATGATVAAALRVVRSHNPSQVVVASPVVAHDAVQRLRNEVDDLVVLVEPRSFHSVGAWYDNFDQTTDDEVARLLAENAEPAG